MSDRGEIPLAHGRDQRRVMRERRRQVHVGAGAEQHRHTIHTVTRDGSDQRRVVEAEFDGEVDPLATAFAEPLQARRVGAACSFRNRHVQGLVVDAVDQ